MPITGARQQKLLALLLLDAERVVTIERLVDELWETPPRSVRQQIHNAIARLRRTFASQRGGVRIDRTDAGYLLHPGDAWIDFRRFADRVRDAQRIEAEGQWPEAIQSLQLGLALWRGNALVGLDGAAVRRAAASLDEQRLTANERLMELRLRVGESISLIGELTRLVAEHPLRESPRVSLMQALHRAGRQGEALRTYDEARRVLAEELGLDPSPNLRKHHAAVLADAVDAVPEVEQRLVQGSDLRVARSYLPRGTSDFTGRTAELDALLECTRHAVPSTVVISVLDGMGGVGKTALAVQFGHLVAKDYPDGQYFLNLHGFSLRRSPVSSAEALEMLLRDSGVSAADIPSTLEGRSALWRSVTAGKKALLILDNAADAAHVRPLLPGTAGGLVVVTSRRKLTALEGALPMSLDVLPHNDAVALFTGIVGADRVEDAAGAVSTVVRMCGHQPLAIRIAASRLRDRTTWTVVDLVRRLGNQAQRSRFLEVDDRSVMAALKLSCRYLSREQQLVFRVLSLHPGGDFDSHTAAVLSELPLVDAESCLEALFDLNLIKQHEPGRFYFHDLVRDCSRQLMTEADDGERTAAVLRLRRHGLVDAGLG